MKSLKLKCGVDIYSHKEVKEEAFGKLQQRNYRSLERSRGMANACTLLKVAETRAKAEADADQWKRAQALKEQMYRDLHQKAEILKSTKDPKELGKVMERFGFPVPELLKPKKEEKKEE